jgi:hypothetical protein
MRKPLATSNPPASAYLSPTFVTPQAGTSSVSEVTAEDVATAVAAAPGDEKGAARRHMLIERNLRAEQELRRGDFDACVGAPEWQS